MASSLADNLPPSRMSLAPDPAVGQGVEAVPRGQSLEPDARLCFGSRGLLICFFGGSWTAECCKIELFDIGPGRE